TGDLGKIARRPRTPSRRDALGKNEPKTQHDPTYPRPDHVHGLPPEKRTQAAPRDDRRASDWEKRTQRALPGAARGRARTPAGSDGPSSISSWDLGELF